MGTLAYVGLGSNLGDREEMIQAALGAIARAPGVRLLRCSSIIETDPAGGPLQGRFLNAVAEVEVDIDPRDLLHCLLEIEEGMGRVRAGRWGPRFIDLDLLLYGEEILKEGDLEVPHPRMQDRLFVLRPLAELDGSLRIPPGEETVEEILHRIERTEVP
jgi:2-amino-4-hydroxy-6-hydroxymethyldihydropteridine diphosphokinase